MYANTALIPHKIPIYLNKCRGVDIAFKTTKHESVLNSPKKREHNVFCKFELGGSMDSSSNVI
jgi:hypothetical protein